MLLTNDDGYSSSGIKLLHSVLQQYYEVTVVAPKSEKSGVSHSFTYHQPLECKKITDSYAENLFTVDGSPSDCVKFAVSYLCEKKPDMIVSGINIGENSGVSSIYSGTVAAAREGAFWKIPSFAFSVFKADSESETYFSSIIPRLLDHFFDNDHLFGSNTYFNINYPPCKPSFVKGVKITKQSLAFFSDEYRHVSSGDTGKSYQLFGEKLELEKSDEYDSSALEQHWITITPHSFDTTAYRDYYRLKTLEKSFSIKV